MKLFIILLSKLFIIFTKLFKRHVNFPGKMALKIDDSILKQIRIHSNIIVVTGSSGKTSTIKMIYKVLKNSGFSVANNLNNSNIMTGIVTAILSNSNLNGEVKKDILLIECDENEIEKLLRNIKPKYLLITNLLRNNLSQKGNVEYVLSKINKSLMHETRLILNVDDPISALIGQDKKKNIYFGINKSNLKEEYKSIYFDGKYCPSCKKTMNYNYIHFAHLGDYRCTSCGYSRKIPNYEITSLDMEKNIITINKNHKIILNRLDIFKAYNVIATYAVARVFGIDEGKIVSILTKEVFNDECIRKEKNNGLELNNYYINNENIISCEYLFNQIVKEKEDCIVIIDFNILHNKSDTSWIWDTNFEILNDSHVKRIYVVGNNINDLIVRFKYSLMPNDKILTFSSMKEVNSFIKEKEEKENKIFAITIENKEVDD